MVLIQARHGYSSQRIVIERTIFSQAFFGYKNLFDPCNDQYSLVDLEGLHFFKDAAELNRATFYEWSRKTRLSFLYQARGFKLASFPVCSRPMGLDMPFRKDLIERETSSF